MKRVVITAAGTVAIGAVAAACGSNSHAISAVWRHSPAASQAATASAGTGNATIVSLQATPRLGPKALVGTGGRTLTHRWPVLGGSCSRILPGEGGVQFAGVGGDDRVRAYSWVRSLGDIAHAFAGGLLPEAEERKFLAKPR
jgi:hypothetical protein